LKRSFAHDAGVSMPDFRSVESREKKAGLEAGALDTAVVFD
jgi:hypothetical protein